MCGIAGLVNFGARPGPDDEELVLELSRQLVHRGPDSHGLHRASHAILAHRRLAVIDLSPGGHQPMDNGNGTVWVTFNGEIYNHRDLRLELIRAGRVFRSDSDTEVLVHGYEQWGLTGLLERLRGMFAFGLWDERKHELHMARDRLGVKPLHFHHSKERLIFASESRPLYSLVKPAAEKLDAEVLDFYLAFGFAPPDACLVRGVEKLAPAHALTFSARGLKVWRYWSLPDLVGGDEAASILPRLEGAIREAVQVRLESDVPLGCFLSGGIDSGLVTAFAAAAQPSAIRTVTVGFAGPAGHDERPLARLVATQFRTAHAELEIGASGLGNLPGLIHLAGEPFADHSLLPTALVCRAARERMTVALTGDGGDELFAGYFRILASHWGERLAGWLTPALCQRLGSALQPWRGTGLGKFGTLATYAGTRLPQLYGESGAIFNKSSRAALCQKQWRLGSKQGAVPRWVGPLADGLGGMGKADAYARLDFALRLPGDYLTKVDVASNACALECRSPFLDHKLAEMAMRLPVSDKLAGGRQKGLLRALARQHLPREVAQGRKRGFGGDIGNWLRVQGAEWWAGLGEFETCVESALLERQQVADLAQHHFSGKSENGEKLWLLLCLEVWWRLFISGSMRQEARL